ncbi:MAG: ribonuclease P [Candidatus Thermoplasmatota archaeon]|nr:ribonuclease P [Candidatus Thermoplasmatota archaeon]
MTGNRRKIRSVRDKELAMRIARDRIMGLYSLSCSTDRADLARRYLEIMQRISERMDITLPREIKRMYCKKCFSPHSRESTIRLKNGIIIIECRHCGAVRRIPYR